MYLANYTPKTSVCTPLIFTSSYVTYVDVSCAALPVTVSSNSSSACIWLWQQASLSVTSARWQSETSEKQTMLIVHVSYELCGHLFLSRCCSPRLPLLLSLSATMATAKDFPGPTTGKYPTRWSLQARFTVWCWIWTWVRTHHSLHTAWAKPSPCMDAHSADASRFLSSHVTGCISYHTICFWFGLPPHNEIDGSMWVALGWRLYLCQCVKFQFQIKILCRNRREHPKFFVELFIFHRSHKQYFC